MTLLIKNGLVVDGTGSEPARTDVFISGERISALGNFNGKKADSSIDAQGMYVTPGFIDAHSEVDHRLELLRGHDDEQWNNGITTAVGGHEGVSLAPLLYGDISLFEWWTHLRNANVDWHTFNDFKHAFAKWKLGYNFATFAGYETVLTAITGGAVRDFQKGESRVARAILDKSMHEGALGVSFGSASRTMKLGHGITEIPADVESGAPWLAQEAFSHAKEGKGKTLISGVLPRMKPKDAEKLISSIENSASRGEVRFSVSPARLMRIPLFSFLSENGREGGRFAALARFTDDAYRIKVEKNIPEIDPKTAYIEHDAPYTPLHERTLKEFMMWQGIKDYRKGITKLMEASELHASLAIPQNETLLSRSRFSPKVLIGSYGSRTAFSEYLTQLFASPAKIAGGIKKITSEVASFFGFVERGLLREKYFADIVGIKDGAVQFVVVNGALVMKDGKHQGVHAGKFL